MPDIHDAILARLEELRSSHWRVGGKIPLNVYWDDRPMFQCHTPEDAARIVTTLNNSMLIDLAVACVKQRCPKCGDTGWTKPSYYECDCNRHALLDDAAEKLWIGGKG